MVTLKNDRERRAAEYAKDQHAGPADFEPSYDINNVDELPTFEDLKGMFG